MEGWWILQPITKCWWWTLNYLGGLYFSLRLICLIHPSPFQISHREPSYSSSLVHRSLAKSMLADWKSSKRGSYSRSFDPPFLAPLVKEKTAQTQLPWMHPFHTFHHNMQCNVQNKPASFFSEFSPPTPHSPLTTMGPSTQCTKCVTCISKQNTPFTSCESEKSSLSNVYWNITEQPTASHSPNDQKDMSTYGQYLLLHFEMALTALHSRKTLGWRPAEKGWLWPISALFFISGDGQIKSTCRRLMNAN